MFVKKFLLSLSAVALSVSSLQAFDLVFDYTYDTNNFFSGPNIGRRANLEAAGAFFENTLSTTDEFTAITSGGVNHFNPTFKNPGSGADESITDYSVNAGEIVVFAGGYDLPGSALGVGGPGGFGASGTSSFLANLQSRGQGSKDANAKDTHYTKWGGTIAFDTLVTWYFDNDVSDFVDDVPSGQNDFYSVAVHELAHVLGFGTVTSFDNKIINGDPGDFTGVNAVAIYNAETAPGDIPLNTGNGHFENGTDSRIFGQEGTTQEAAMDPSITVGTRKYFTTLDVAAMRDIGFTTPVPEPATTALLVGLFALGVLRFRRRG